MGAFPSWMHQRGQVGAWPVTAVGLAQVMGRRPLPQCVPQGDPTGAASQVQPGAQWVLVGGAMHGMRMHLAMLSPWRAWPTRWLLP